jgi:hypothetical protein
MSERSAAETVARNVAIFLSDRLNRRNGRGVDGEKEMQQIVSNVWRDHGGLPRDIFYLALRYICAQIEDEYEREANEHGSTKARIATAQISRHDGR